MATSRPGGMLSSLRCSLCFLLLCLCGINSLNRHLHNDPRYMLQQNKGFFTIDANDDSPATDGGGSAAPALPPAVEGGSTSAAHTPHRSRRSAGESTMPKVYGQVILRLSVRVNAVQHITRSLLQTLSWKKLCKRVVF